MYPGGSSDERGLSSQPNSSLTQPTHCFPPKSSRIHTNGSCYTHDAFFVLPMVLGCAAARPKCRGRSTCLSRTCSSTLGAPRFLLGCDQRSDKFGMLRLSSKHIEIFKFSSLNIPLHRPVSDLNPPFSASSSSQKICSPCRVQSIRGSSVDRDKVYYHTLSGDLLD